MNHGRIIAEIDAQIARLQQARDALAGTSATGTPGKVSRRKGRRRMSAAARARISAAQKKRWAKVKAKQR
jgi:hypothetical protein